MKQSLQLKLGQQLTMTPQLQQAIRLLQLSTLDLQQEIQEALDSNPMLEAEEHGDNDSGDNSSDTSKDNNDTPKENNINETAEERSKSNDSEAVDASANEAQESPEASADSDWSDEIPPDLPVDTSWDDIYQPSHSSSGSGAASGDDDYDFESRNGTTDSLQTHLEWQLNLTPMSDRDHIIAMAIIDAIEPNGMLSATIDDIFEGLSPSLEELELDEVVAVQHRLQQFDPVGVASQNLSECLLVQLNLLPAETPHLTHAKTLVQQHLSVLGNHDYKVLMRKLRIKEDDLRDTISLIQTLNPAPGEEHSVSDTEYVVPDVFVSKRDDAWQVQLNPDIAPKLRINNSYASLVKRADSSSDNNFLRDNLQEARWFLKSLQSRNETLLKVATCIVEKQRGFLDFGEEAMKPLVLHDIAEAVDMHESTISRVTTQKYMHTPQGIFELKYFFSSHVSTDSGGECSSTAIRALIKKLVATESPKKPLSDNKITALLAEQGIKVARRTIAKYRESLGIPPSNERKRLV